MTLDADFLLEENRQLRDAIRPAIQHKFPREWKLSACETAFLQSLYMAPQGGRSVQALHVASNLSGIETDAKIVQIWACRIRKRLKPYGITFDTVWGWGYEMPAASKALISEAMGQ